MYKSWVGRENNGEGDGTGDGEGELDASSSSSSRSGELVLRVLGERGGEESMAVGGDGHVSPH